MRATCALGVLVFCLAACDVQTLYGIEVVDVPEEGAWNAVRNDEYTLYLSGTTDSELTIIVGDRDEITITIRVEFVDAWFDWWFF